MSDGKDCISAAWRESECACGEDLKKLRHRVDQLERDNDVLVRKLKNSIDDCRVLWKQAEEVQDKVTRFEVIDLTSEAVESNFKEFSIPDMGRVLVKYGISVELSYQDDGRTLKVFLKER